MQIEKKKKRRDTCAMWKHVDPKRDGSRLCRGYTAHGTARLLTRKIGSLGVAFEGRCRLWRWGRRWLEPGVEMEFAGWSLKSSHRRVGVANGSGGEFCNRSTILRSLAVLLHAGSFTTAAFPCTWNVRSTASWKVERDEGTRTFHPGTRGMRRRWLVGLTLKSQMRRFCRWFSNRRQLVDVAVAHAMDLPLASLRFSSIL